MKLSFLSVIALFIFSFTHVNAQQEYFEYGFKGGINLSNIVGDQTNGLESRTGMNIGAYGLYKILPKLGIQAELIYSEQGYSNEYAPVDPLTEKVVEDLRMQYINLPILASYNVIENLWVEGGIQLGYLVRAEEEQETTTIGPAGDIMSETVTSGKTDTYERVDIGLGGGLRYKLSPNFMIQARYTNSIRDINKNLSGNQYNSIFSFSVGFLF